MVTANTDEFNRVPGIAVEDWTKAAGANDGVMVRTRISNVKPHPGARFENSRSDPNFGGGRVQAERWR